MLMQTHRSHDAAGFPRASCLRVDRQCARGCREGPNGAAPVSIFLDEDEDDEAGDVDVFVLQGVLGQCVAYPSTSPAHSALEQAGVQHAAVVPSPRREAPPGPDGHHAQPSQHAQHAQDGAGAQGVAAAAAAVLVPGPAHAYGSAPTHGAPSAAAVTELQHAVQHDAQHKTQHTARCADGADLDRGAAGPPAGGPQGAGQTPLTPRGRRRAGIEPPSLPAPHACADATHSLGQRLYARDPEASTPAAPCGLERPKAACPLCRDHHLQGPRHVAAGHAARELLAAEHAPPERRVMGVAAASTCAAPQHDAAAHDVATCSAPPYASPDTAAPLGASGLPSPREPALKRRNAAPLRASLGLSGAQEGEQPARAQVDVERRSRSAQSPVCTARALSDAQPANDDINGQAATELALPQSSAAAAGAQEDKELTEAQHALTTQHVSADRQSAVPARVGPALRKVAGSPVPAGTETAPSAARFREKTGSDDATRSAQRAAAAHAAGAEVEALAGVGKQADAAKASTQAAGRARVRSGKAVTVAQPKQIPARKRPYSTSTVRGCRNVATDMCARDWMKILC